ncbi:MAG TPA: hypothetical protein PK299_07110 [Anaerolineales bacterium]|nr:hypothetical protein [Anaerolineales bacterium]
MYPSTDDLRQLIMRAEAGDIDGARDGLRDFVQKRPGVLLAWKWLADLAANPRERADAIRRARFLAPGDPWVQEASKHRMPPKRPQSQPTSQSEMLPYRTLGGGNSSSGSVGYNGYGGAENVSGTGQSYPAVPTPLYGFSQSPSAQTSSGFYEQPQLNQLSSTGGFAPINTQWQASNQTTTQQQRPNLSQSGRWVVPAPSPANAPQNGAPAFPQVAAQEFHINGGVANSQRMLPIKPETLGMKAVQRELAQQSGVFPAPVINHTVAKSVPAPVTPTPDSKTTQIGSQLRQKLQGLLKPKQTAPLAEETGTPIVVKDTTLAQAAIPISHTAPTVVSAPRPIRGLKPSTQPQKPAKKKGVKLPIGLVLLLAAIFLIGIILLVAAIATSGVIA